MPQDGGEGVATVTTAGGRLGGLGKDLEGGERGRFEMGGTREISFKPKVGTAGLVWSHSAGLYLGGRGERKGVFVPLWKLCAPLGNFNLQN